MSRMINALQICDLPKYTCKVVVEVEAVLIGGIDQAPYETMLVGEMPYVRPRYATKMTVKAVLIGVIDLSPYEGIGFDKITKIEPDAYVARIRFSEPCRGSLRVSAQYMEVCRPYIGEYYVIYPGAIIGCVSRQEFERDYEKVEDKVGVGTNGETLDVAVKVMTCDDSEVYEKIIDKTP